MIHHGDVRDVLPTLPDQSVQCVVTSPPYWGLRDYGTAAWDGGDPGCEHKSALKTSSGLRQDGRKHIGFYDGEKDAENRRKPYLSQCGVCGAVRRDRQIGLEPTPEAYLETLVGVFREVRRVLREDGTLWLNMGDSYANTGNTHQKDWSKSCAYGGKGHALLGGQPEKAIPPGLKQKDLIGMPWRLAFALQADGWYLRSDIIWAKALSFCDSYSGSVMPESVTDRPTKAHEYLFLLTKSARYFYDADAVREHATFGTDRGLLRGRGGTNGSKGSWHAPSIATRQAAGVDSRTAGSGYRNLRDVWTINPQPFSEAHFATFPMALVEPCIKAGSRKGDTVMDPFAGSGTVGIVAQRYGRAFVGIELNDTYAEMARAQVDGPLFA